MCQTDNELIVEGESVSSISKLDNDRFQCIEYNMITKELKLSERKRNESQFHNLNLSESQSWRIIDQSSKGFRWEGLCVHNSSCGYGNLFNDDNELMYRGVMINDKKECFGTEYYPGLGLVEYIGCYCNNERHGFGLMYGCKGDLLYEGEFLCGNGDYDKCIKIENMNCDDSCIHNWIEELLIGDNCFVETNVDIILNGWMYLKVLSIGNSSFRSVNSLSLNSMMIYD